MFADVVFFPEQASTTAHHVDQFFLFLVCVCGSVGVLVAVLLIYFSVRYRRRPGDAQRRIRLPKRHLIPGWIFS